MHVRLMREGAPFYPFFTAELASQNMMPQQYRATTDIADPDTIYFVHDPRATPSTTARTVSHETLHNTFARLGERDASFALDTLRNPFKDTRPTRTGLYPRRRGKPRMFTVLDKEGLHLVRV